MESRTKIHLLVVLCLVLAANGAYAQLSMSYCADPANCTFPYHALVCPKGDGTTYGSVLNSNGRPCVGGTIVMEFLPPATTNLHPIPGSQFPVLGATVGSSGRVVFSPQAGGNAMTGTAEFTQAGSGLVLGHIYSFNSPDINGDGAVNAQDMTIFMAIYNGPSYENNVDFNLDGVINLTDLVIMNSHMGH